jgi:hypothetical protein
MAAHYRLAEFTPPYPTWPFTLKAIHGLQGQSPRKLFQLCESHRRRCIEAGSAAELHTFDDSASTGAPPARDEFEALDQAYQRRRAEADLAELRDEKNEDDQLAPMRPATSRCGCTTGGPTSPSGAPTST